MKKTILLSGIIFLFFLSNAQIPTDGLVGYWPFNGNALDESGNGNDGTVNGATLTEDRFGNPNSAYFFNGIDNYINIGNPLSNSITPFSISVWYKKNIATGGILLAKKPSLDWSYGRWQLSVQDTININYCYPNPQNGSCTEIPLSVIDTNWHFIVFSVNNTSAQTYFDGRLINQANIDIVQQADADIYIGDREDVNKDPFNGIIDDVRIYNKGLTACEVRALYFEGENEICSVYDSIAVTDTLIINAVLTGVNPPNNINTIKIYPNPAKTHIYINNGNYNLMNGYSIKIDNSLGQTVFTSEIDRQEFYIDLSNWTGNGTYFVYITDNNSNIIEVRKIILQ